MHDSEAKLQWLEMCYMYGINCSNHDLEWISIRFINLIFYVQNQYSLFIFTTLYTWLKFEEWTICSDEYLHSSMHCLRSNFEDKWAFLILLFLNLRGGCDFYSWQFDHSYSDLTRFSYNLASIVITVGSNWPNTAYSLIITLGWLLIWMIVQLVRVVEPGISCVISI